jgi:hypothetical protein
MLTDPNTAEPPVSGDPGQGTARGKTEVDAKSTGVEVVVGVGFLVADCMMLFLASTKWVTRRDRTVLFANYGILGIFADSKCIFHNVESSLFLLQHGMNCQDAAWCFLLQTGHSAPKPRNMKGMLLESDDK